MPMVRSEREVGQNDLSRQVLEGAAAKGDFDQTFNGGFGSLFGTLYLTSLISSSVPFMT